MFKRFLSFTFVIIAAGLLFSANVRAQGTAFTYQGKLTDGVNQANGPYDFQFTLFDALSGGTKQGSTVTVTNVTVAAGIFTAQLDFGACPTCFNGAARFLEIPVKLTSGSTYTTLSPRQPVTSTPYAIRSLNATAADGLSVACINCVTSSQIQSVNGSAVTGTIPLASVPDLGASYIKNSMALQANSDFHISGNGTAAVMLSSNIVNATTQYNLNGSRILSNPGTNNLVGGVGAGQANTTGCCSTFFGFNAGAVSNANDNSFF